MTENIIPHDHAIKKENRIARNGYKPLLVWFTGLSGSGKSTLASALEKELFAKGLNTYILDGDNVRKGLNSDLDFTDEGRKENIRRIGEVSNLFIDAGVVVLTAFISPFVSDRAQAKSLVGAENFVEVFVDCPLEVCEQRDVKGLYAKARKGEIKNFTGIDSPFEKPTHADLVIQSDKTPVEDGVKALLTLIEEKIKK